MRDTFNEQLSALETRTIGDPAVIKTSALFESVRNFLLRFVVLGDNEATAVALWIMMTHLANAFDCVPYLWIKSAEKQCGKTRLLEVMELLVNRPWLTGRVTPAVLARKVDKVHPTLLLDELDATVKGDKEFAQTLRGVLNTGYLSSGKTSVCVPKGRTIDYDDLSTFGPKALAGIGTLWDTVADRSIPIQLTRRLPTETVERFRRRYVKPEADAIARDLAAWVKTLGEEMATLPRGLEALPDRAADICEPLMVIAEAGGDKLADEALKALVALCGREREDLSRGVQLLTDIRSIFFDGGYDRMSSAKLASKLASIEESPWGPSFGHEFNPRELARLLKQYDIKPGTIRLTDDDETDTAKGYYARQFTDAWARFLPSPEKASQASQASQDPVAHPSHGSEPSPKEAREMRDVTDVTDVTASRGSGEPRLSGESAVEHRHDEKAGLQLGLQGDLAGEDEESWSYNMRVVDEVGEVHRE